MRNGVSETMRNIVSSAVEPARVIGRGCHLAGTRIGIRDAIFRAGRPVLVGVDTASTSCCVRSGAI